MKGAFVDGRLTRDELDMRMGRSLAARTYADLAALTADIAGTPRSHRAHYMQSATVGWERQGMGNAVPSALAASRLP